jgi:hypothetical protein
MNDCVLESVENLDLELLLPHIGQIWLHHIWLHHIEAETRCRLFSPYDCFGDVPQLAVLLFLSAATFLSSLLFSTR